jgi:hypothetical protein
MLELYFSHSRLLHRMICLQSRCWLCKANRLPLAPTPLPRKMRCQRSWLDCGRHGLSNDALLELDPGDAVGQSGSRAMYAAGQKGRTSHKEPLDNLEIMGLIGFEPKLALPKKNLARLWNLVVIWFNPKFWLGWTVFSGRFVGMSRAAAAKQLVVPTIGRAANSEDVQNWTLGSMLIWTWKSYAHELTNWADSKHNNALSSQKKTYNYWNNLS